MSDMGLYRGRQRGGLIGFRLREKPMLGSLVIGASAVVRSADTGRLDLAPEAAGLLAVSLGISAAKDDHADLMQGMFLCDALYS